mmetsp:Transcript_32711/g.73435  ORF Transcript_32711/g.73435 Transcript_32711/m.73435 type:complete len:212 (-) Transcript_32711:564-1199(-)
MVSFEADGLPPSPPERACLAAAGQARKHAETALPETAREPPRKASGPAASGLLPAQASAVVPEPAVPAAAAAAVGRLGRLGRPGGRAPAPWPAPAHASPSNASLPAASPAQQHAMTWAWPRPRASAPGLGARRSRPWRCRVAPPRLLGCCHPLQPQPSRQGPREWSCQKPWLDLSRSAEALGPEAAWRPDSGPRCCGRAPWASRPSRHALG